MDIIYVAAIVGGFLGVYYWGSKNKKKKGKKKIRRSDGC